MVSHFLDTMSIRGIIVSTLHILYRKGNKGVCVCMCVCVCVCVIFYHHPLDWVVTFTSISWEKVLWKTAETFVEMLDEISQSGLSLKLYPKIPQHLKITTLPLLCCCGFEQLLKDKQCYKESWENRVQQERERERERKVCVCVCVCVW